MSGKPADSGLKKVELDSIEDTRQDRNQLEGGMMQVDTEPVLKLFRRERCKSGDWREAVQVRRTVEQVQCRLVIFERYSRSLNTKARTHFAAFAPRFVQRFLDLGHRSTFLNRPTTSVHLEPGSRLTVLRHAVYFSCLDRVDASSGRLPHLPRCYGRGLWGEGRPRTSTCRGRAGTGLAPAR